MKILYFTANPEMVVMPNDPENLKETDTKIADYTKLDLWPELKEVANVFYEGRMDGDVHLEVVPEARADDVVRYIDRFRPDIVHFSGHGEEKRLIVNDSDYFAGETLGSQWLKETLQDKGVSVLVLNCCWSSSFVDDLKDTVGLVVGAKQRLQVDKAQAFAAVFYTGLRDGRPVSEAYNKASKVSAQYQAEPKSGPVWDNAMSVDVLADPVVSRLADQRAELLGLQTQVSTELALDATKVFAGLSIAFVAFWVLNGTDVSWLVGEEADPLWKMFDEDTQSIMQAWQDQEWMASEPFALFFILMHKSIARCCSWAWSRLSLSLAIRTIDFSMFSHRWVKAHQVEARLEGVINWVRGTTRGQ